MQKHNEYVLSENKFLLSEFMSLNAMQVTSELQFTHFKHKI